MTSAENWYRTAILKLHLDYHEPPWMRGVAEAVTPERAREQARLFRQAGVEAVEIFAHDHHGFCFFPTEHGLAHPGLAQDYTGHMAAALRAEGLRTIAYMNVYTNIHLKAQHPDWVLTTADGVRPGGGWLQFEGSYMCPSSPYLETYFLPLLRHVIERFDFDAVWLDGGSWLVDTLCICDFCREQFGVATGRELPHNWPERPSRRSDVIIWSPAGPPRAQTWSLGDDDGADEDWVTWRIWRRGQIQSYLDKVVQTARAVKPSILITDNNSGRWSMPQPLVEHGHFARWLRPRDLGIDYLSCDPVPFGGNHEVILSREGRYQATTGLPFDYMNERFHKWGEWQLRSTTDFQLEFATLLAVGGLCFFADQPHPDGALELAVYDRLREAYAFVAEREPFVRGSEMVPDIAILASAPSQIFGPYGNGRDAGRQSFGPVGSEPVGSRTDRVEGAHLALIELGGHCLLYDEPTLRERLAEQTAAIVAEQCLLEDATLDALRSYVEAGGGLLVTGRTGRWDEQYRPRAHTRLYDLLGIEVVGDLAAPIHYIRPHDTLLQGTGLPDMPIQCWGTAVQVRLAAATALADLVGPRAEVWRDGIQDEDHWQHYTTVGACPPGREVVGPAITIREVGRGRVVYVAVDPFAAYRYEGHHLARLLLGRLLDLVAPPSTRRISAGKPLHIELSLQRQGERLIAHLVNYFGQKRTTVLAQNEEIVPVHDILLRVRTERPPRQVTVQPEGTKLECEYLDGIASVRVPQLHLHTMVVFDEAA